MSNIYAYKDGQFLTLQEAYDKEIISKDILEYISYFSRDKEFDYEII